MPNRGATYLTVRPRQVTCAYLGDSLTAGGIGTYNYGDAYPTYVAPGSAGRIMPAGFYGIGGQRSDQIAQRVQAALATRPSYLAVLAGTNDMGQGISTGKSDAQILDTLKANLRAMYRAAEAVGTVPVAITVPPNNDSSNSNRRQLLIQKANLWIRRHAMIKGYPLVDFYGLLVKDGIAATPAGNYKDAYALDGTHPNAAGCGAMGALFAQVLDGASLVTPYPFIVQDTVDQYRAVSGTPNPLWASQTSAPNVRPDSTGQLSNTADTHTVYTLATDSVIPGRVQTITWDTSATLPSAGLTGGACAAAKGDVVAFAGYFSTDGSASFQAQLNLGGITSKAVSLGQAGSAITRGMYYIEVAATVAANAATNYWTLIGGARTGYAATVSFGCPTVVNLTQLIGETVPITPN